MGWNLATAWERVALEVPDADALICGDTVRSWREFEDRAARLAAALEGLGLGPRSMVGLALYNGNDYLEAEFACFKQRCSPFNINYRYTAEELRSLLLDADAEVVFFSPELGERLDTVRHDLRNLRALVQVGRLDGEPTPEWALDYETLVADHEPLPPRHDRSVDDDLWILYTGGTTGHPKGVMWPHSSLWRVSQNPFAGAKVTPPSGPDDLAAAVHALRDKGYTPRQLAASPLMHGTAGVSSIGVLTQGGCLLTLPQRRFDPHALWQCVQDHGVTHAVIVGDVFARPMVEALEEAAAAGRPYRTDSLAMLYSSGVMFSASSKEALLAHVDVRIYDLLGSSEGVGFATSASKRGSTASTASFKLGPDAAVFTEDGRRVEPGSGERGMLAVGGAIPIGYYGDPAKTAETFRVVEGRNWSIPGDWATVEVDGTITLLGRGSVCINTAGEKVYPEEVEEVLKLHPAVLDANVVGLADPTWGQAVTAVISLVPGSTVGDDELVAAARDHLAGYKLPKRIVRVSAVERGANGKPDYRWATDVAQRATSQAG